jgi:DNA-binding MarR family transcriptional regulator
LRQPELSPHGARGYPHVRRRGVRSTQFAILIGVAKTQPVSMSVLAKVLVIDHTTLTRSVRLLQKEKLVTISERSTMRRKFLELTPAGERALERSLPLWRAVHAQFVSTVGSDYWLKLRSELEGLAKTTMALEPLHQASTAKKNKQAKRPERSNPIER